MSSKQEYLDLCKKVWHHNRLYYVEHAPEISDQEFDQLLQSLQEIEKRHPGWIFEGSPTQRVGEMLTSGFKSAPHAVPMLSLANSYAEEEVEAFVQRCCKVLSMAGVELSAELKMDGIAVSVRYEKGQFVRALTRGNGKKGDDITQNIRTLSSVPLMLLGKDLPEVLEIRGEVYMPHAVFEELNKGKEEPWANPRNAAAGSLKLLDPKEVAKRGLEVVFYAIAEPAVSPVPRQHQVPEYLRSLGLPTLALHAHCKEFSEVWDFAKSVQEQRSTLPFDIDGIVLKVDELVLHKKLAATGKTPRWAIAYKFAAEQAESRVEGITVQVGRTGVITPVAELTPTLLAGSTISRATLHNQEEVERKDVRIGDFVLIEKGGDVIPKVVSVVLEKRAVESAPWQMPSSCPSCSSPLTRREGEVAYRCTNSTGCPAQTLRRLIYFVSKQGLDIEHLGEKVVTQLVQIGAVHTVADFFALSANQLFQLEGFQERSVKNVLASLERSKNPPLARFIMALGIPFVGSETAELLAKKGKAMDGVAALTFEELLSIDGIGEKVAGSVLHFFSSREQKAVVARLHELGVEPEEFLGPSFSDHFFEGKIFVITGTLEEYSRQQAAALIKERGGKVSSSVSKKTDFLLAGVSAGSKLEKAQKLGVAVLSEEQFATYLKSK